MMKAELIVDAPIVNQKRIWIKALQKPYFDHPFHYHPVCELTWIETGHGKLIVGDYVGNFSDGELILENAWLPHLWKCDQSFYDQNSTSFIKAIALYFPSTLIPNLIDDQESISLYKDALRKAERGLRFYGQTKFEIIELIKGISSTSNALLQLTQFLQIIYIITKTTEFENLAGISYKNNYDDQDMVRFNEVYNFLLQNFKQDIKLADVANICNMTPNSFCRFFKAKTQKTYTRFLNELRIGHACKLLQKYNGSVTDICYESGYNSPVNFFKFFKLITQRTPQEYRKYIKSIA